MPETGFTPGRDHGPRGLSPISESMSSAVTRNAFETRAFETRAAETRAAETRAAETRASDLHLLRDCLALGHPAHRRPPAKVRLEEALGPELARKLLRSLSVRRPGRR